MPISGKPVAISGRPMGKEATGRCCEPTCLSLGSLFGLDLWDIWPKSNVSRDINFYLVIFGPVIFGPMNYFLVTDRQTDRRTDGRRCIRAHRALIISLVKTSRRSSIFAVFVSYIGSILKKLGTQNIQWIYYGDMMFALLVLLPSFREEEKKVGYSCRCIESLIN